MNRSRLIAAAIAFANLVLILLFPPYDYLSVQRGNIPTFSGFDLYFSAHPNQFINGDFLALEIIVVLVNAAITLLLLNPKPAVGGRTALYRRGLLWIVAINLVLMLLFPPFENYTAVTKAALPSFDGFFFVFGDNSQRQIVTTILTIEIVLVLVNGGLIWLMLGDRGRQQLTPEEIRAMAQRVRAEQRKI